MVLPLYRAPFNKAGGLIIKKRNMGNKSKIERKIKIMLTEYDATWDSSYIIVATRGFRDNMNFQKTVSSIQRKLDKAEKLAKVAARKFDRELEKEDINEEMIDKYTKEEDTYTQETEKYAEEIIDKMMTFLQDRFRSGEIYDTRDGKLREMTKDDILDFDNDVITALSNRIIGGISKKD